MFYLAKKNILRSKTEDIFWAWFIEKVLSWFPEIIHFALSGKYDFVFLPIIFLRFVEEKNKEQTSLMISLSILTLYLFQQESIFPGLTNIKFPHLNLGKGVRKKWTLSRYQDFHPKHFQISLSILFSCTGQLNNWHCLSVGRSEPTNNQSLQDAPIVRADFDYFPPFCCCKVQTTRAGLD